MMLFALRALPDLKPIMEGLASVDGFTESGGGVGAANS